MHGKAGKAQLPFLQVPSPPHRPEHRFHFHLHILLLKWLHNQPGMCLAEARSLYSHPSVPMHEPELCVLLVHRGNNF